MTNERLQQIVEEIWDEIPRDSGRLLFDGDRDYPGLVGNRDGLIRLAGELLWSAKAQMEYPGQNVAYLFTSQSVLVPYIRHAEIEDSRPRQPSEWKSNLAKAGCLILLLALGVCVVVGFFTLLGKL
jgi:hypothetical protein